MQTLEDRTRSNLATAVADAPPPVNGTAMPAPGPVPSRSGPTRGVGAVFSAAVLAVGILGLVDVAGANIVASAYLAVGLAVIGAGLVIGAWYGRVRPLIVLGALVSVILIIVTAVERLATVDHSVAWRPTSIEQLDSPYTVNVGEAVLDLSQVDFAGRSEELVVEVGAGSLTVIVPSTVDVRAEVEVDVGNAVVFGQQWSGVGQSRHTVTDTGNDGPGGGELTIRASVDVGDVEVRR